MLGLGGITAMDTSVAAVTVKLVEPVTAPSVAVILVKPGLAALASPLEPAALLMVAIAGADDVQVTVVVRFCVVLSE